MGSTESRLPSIPKIGLEESSRLSIDDEVPKDRR